MPSCTRFQSNNNPFILCPPPLSWSLPQLLPRVPSLPCLTVLTPNMVHTCSPAWVCVSTTRRCNWVGDKSPSLSVSLCLYLCVCLSNTLNLQVYINPGLWTQMGISLLAHSSGTNKQKLLINTDAEDMSHARLSPLLLTNKPQKKKKDQHPQAHSHTQSPIHSPPPYFL